MGSVSRRRLVVSDFIMSFMWVWSSVLIKMFVHTILGYGAHDLKGDILKHAISVINMFFFAFLVKATKGGAYNPLTILSGAISGDLTNFIFTVAARIPAQVFGSITGVRLIIAAFPNIGRGPRLSIDIHRGALTEGCLTFAIVSISLGLSRRSHASTFMKTWISSLSKLTLHILGSDLTGGCMNPASVMGWAYARGDHITKEHIHVYWLAPIQATLLSVWTFNLLVSPPKDEKDKKREKKSE
ncbi:putative aquaporin SIP2-1 [Capsicum baccatum]|uniref:Aquaporin SIP2-1 n=1 Tax=Capsicum baccatum TaxID=33114 RepID=A0A2G2XPZ6_CAPBA|nr:putative aquaporin SIP2-1 [Capsicum baccatum]